MPPSPAVRRTLIGLLLLAHLGLFLSRDAAALLFGARLGIVPNVAVVSILIAQMTLLAAWTALESELQFAWRAIVLGLALPLTVRWWIGPHSAAGPAALLLWFYVLFPLVLGLIASAALRWGGFRLSVLRAQPVECRDGRYGTATLLALCLATALALGLLPKDARQTLVDVRAIQQIWQNPHETRWVYAHLVMMLFACLWLCLGSRRRLWPAMLLGVGLMAQSRQSNRELVTWYLITCGMFCATFLTLRVAGYRCSRRRPRPAAPEAGNMTGGGLS
ncbi:MAG: hypothetical protein K1X74_05630 [Pirellulales bacterium]|nr:hypothetical protein [Pirellulales bacterium]